MSVIIGIDLDNTIVSYDNLIYRVASERNLIPPDISKNKKIIRDHIRQTLNGEEEWTKLQAVVYGERMSEAQVIEGVQSFFKLCRQRGIKTYIISQKSQFAKYDRTKTDMRLAALQWMKNNSFFDEDGLGLPPANIIFKSTRKEKIDAIREKNCAYFIDDLMEVLTDSSFPPETKRILFDSESENELRLEIRVINSWKVICDYFFNP